MVPEINDRSRVRMSFDAGSAAHDLDAMTRFVHPFLWLPPPPGRSPAPAVSEACPCVDVIARIGSGAEAWAAKEIRAGAGLDMFVFVGR